MGKSHSRRTVLLAFWLTLLVGVQASGRIPRKQYLPPPLLTVQDQALFLGFLSNELPELFREGTEYDVDLLQFLALQGQAVAHLESNPSYLEALRNRGPLQEIKISRESRKKAAAQKIVHPGAWDRFGDAWSRAVRAHERQSAHYYLRLLNQLRVYENKFGTLKLSGALTGLLSLLPQPQRGALFQRDIHDVIDELPQFAGLLENNLERFRFEAVGLKPMPLSELLELLKDATTHWTQLQVSLFGYLVEALYAEEKGSQLGQDMGFEEDAATLFLSDMAENLSRHLPGDSGLIAESLRELSKQVVLKVAAEAVPEEEVLLTLREVPGYLATLRGFVGVDCATQASFAYALLPKERTFFVFDPEGVALGYVMLTELESSKKPAIYVHDFSGPRISKEQVRLALYGLQQAFAEQGVNTLILPNAESSFRNINFKHIRAQVDNLAARGAPVNLGYTDADLRVWMQSMPVGVDHGYDTPEANPDGMRVKLHEADSVRVSVAETSWPDVEDSHLEPAVLKTLALEVNLPTWSVWAKATLTNALGLTEAPQQIRLMRARAAAHLYQLAGGTIQNWPLVISGFLSNPQQFSASLYRASLEPQLRQEGLDFDRLVIERPHLFYEGVLFANDAITTREPWARDLVFKALRAAIVHRDQLELVQDALSHQFDVIKEQPEFHQLVRDLIRDRESTLRVLKTFLEWGLSPSQLLSYVNRLTEISQNSLNNRTRALAGSILNQIADANCSQILLDNQDEG